jgi:hypothetical protein
MKKEIFVKIGSKKNGRYYASEEYSLFEFMDFIDIIDVIVPVFAPKIVKKNMINVISGKYKESLIYHKGFIDGRVSMGEDIINGIKYIAEKDKPGKKVKK